VSRQRSGARRTTSEAREEFLRRSAEAWDNFNAWHQEHPEATFDEMEEKLGQQRRGILGDFLELGMRQGDLGATPEGPSCERCRKPMVFKGYAEKTIQGLEAEAKIPRAYYVCPTCKEGLFPPGPAAAAEER
jgi:hypothetical protein